MKILKLGPNIKDFSVTREGDILKTLNHENVIKHVDSFITSDK